MDGTAYIPACPRRYVLGGTQSARASPFVMLIWLARRHRTGPIVPLFPAAGTCTPRVLWSSRHRPGSAPRTPSSQRRARTPLDGPWQGQRAPDNTGAAALLLVRTLTARSHPCFWGSDSLVARSTALGPLRRPAARAIERLRMRPTDLEHRDHDAASRLHQNPPTTCPTPVTDTGIGHCLHSLHHLSCRHTSDDRPLNVRERFVCTSPRPFRCSPLQSGSDMTKHKHCGSVVDGDLLRACGHAQDIRTRT